MNGLYQEIIDKFSEFLIKISYGLDGFQYNGKHIGSAVLLLNFIKANPDCTMTDIKDYLKVTPSTATRRVDKLVELGLVQRAIGLEDHRSIALSLTSEGCELFTQYQQKRFQGLQELNQKFDPEQIETFLLVLDFFNDISDEFIENS